MTRTPDDIKEGLECCMDYQSCTDCGEPQCPYNDVRECVDTLLADAIALIQQLEAQNAELQAELDAALEDKRGECTYCAYLPGETIPQTCFDCANKGFYRWEWRGVQKEG